MDTSTLFILAMVAGKLIIIGLWCMAIYWVAKTIQTLFTGAARIREIRQQTLDIQQQTQLITQTNLHYYDHPDRYFDYQQGQWVWKQEQTHA